MYEAAELWSEVRPIMGQQFYMLMLMVHTVSINRYQMLY
jgi:hypothetical protein